MEKKLKKHYTLEEINQEMISVMLTHKDTHFRENLIRNKLIGEEELTFLSKNDPDKRISELASEELEKIIDSKRKRKRRIEPINYFEMDLKGLSVGNEDYEELPSERKINIQRFKENEKGEVFIKGKICQLFRT